MSVHVAPTSSKSWTWPRSHGNRLIDTCIYLLVLGIMGVVSARAPNRERKLCSEVHSRCFGREGCKFALENYFMGCLDLSDGEEFQCTERCKMALIMLLSSEGHDGPNSFRDCDCEDDEFCLDQKDKIEVCADDVQTWLDDINNPNTPISCSLAHLVCSADTPCLAAIEYYHDHCKKLLEPHNPRCTSRCNNSLNILYRQTKAQKLRTCVCDGRELYNCTALKDNTQNLCYGERVRHPPVHDHTRCGHNTPHTQNPLIRDSDSDSDSNNIDSIAKDVSSHSNSAYTLHSRASALFYRTNAHVMIVLLGFILVFWCQR